MVYLMRTSELILHLNSLNNYIFVMSIIQSILSMTNATINNDNAYMIDKKWKKYKQKFPIPHYNFLRHFSFRLFEVFSRIGIFS